MSDTSIHSIADIATPQASRYLQQLCKHFAHKLPVTFDEHAGQIGFPFGTCRLEADDDNLTLLLAAPDEAQSARLQQVVADHLRRFAFRDPPEIVWRADGAVEAV